MNNPDDVMNGDNLPMFFEEIEDEKVDPKC